MKTYIHLEITNEQQLQLTKIAALNDCNPTALLPALAQKGFNEILTRCYAHNIKQHAAAPQPINWEAGK